MKRPSIAALALLLMAPNLYAAERCQAFHGRALAYSADGQVRIWHIGTHHTFMPGTDDDHSTWPPGWEKVLDLINRGNPHPLSPDDQQLFADFTVCPVESFHQGAAQRASVKAISHPVTVPRSR